MLAIVGDTFKEVHRARFQRVLGTDNAPAEDTIGGSKRFSVSGAMSKRIDAGTKTFARTDRLIGVRAIRGQRRATRSRAESARQWH